MPELGWAGRPRPNSAQFGRPFAPVGPQVIMHFAPSTCDFDDVILASKMEVLRA
jgi:hypothetical protein